jgi:hypothetical protein
MNKIAVGVVGGALVGAALCWMATTKREVEAEASPRRAAESRVVQVDGATFVKLDQEGQARAGIEVTALQTITLQPELEVYGRVLDPGPLATLLAERATARSALEISTKELKRLRLLYGQEQNVSTRTLEAAEVATKRDQVIADTAELKLVSAWGRPVVRAADTPGFLQSLGARDVALVRVDIALQSALPDLPVGARVSAATAADTFFAASVLGSAPNVEPQIQGQGFVLLVRDAGLIPGAAIRAWLATSRAPQSATVVPRSALLRQNDEVLVFVQAAPELFVRRAVTLAQPIEIGMVVRTGLKPGDRVVTVGAQQLLSEELKGQAAEE